MENMKLIICGNGFDLHHGLKTNYLSYKKYLEDSHSEILSELEAVRNILDFSITESDFWYDVEGNLSDIYNHTFFHYDENSMDRLISVTYQFTGGAFLEWLCHVYKQGKKEIKTCDKFSEIMSNSLFINFNYTQTLEEIYSVNKENILYIHGSIASVIKKQFELGNNSNMLDDNLTHNIIEFGASDIKLNPVIASLSNENTEKKISFYTSPTKHLKGKIENIKKFIKNKEIAEVIILGHSLSGDDLYYFNDVFLSKYREIPWTFYYYDEKYQKRKCIFALDSRIHMFTIKPYPNKLEV